ncbi:lipoyl synthase [Microscilla marina]|uniref:Lipoyl synthase n=1 Tax=Microscilla marina ATCC 23134 TaxID=313606 RepID=A1ZHQ4_MICM2|nr:lipoyl synthase [Microscilla marina]EAY30061.1 lipoic acid synthetase [Microscilla marina ATCC 23134]
MKETQNKTTLKAPIKDKQTKLGKPKWLKLQIPTGKEYLKVDKIVEDHGLHTICRSGKCPNIGECWGSGTATLMILGDVCTRACTFCSVKTGRPDTVDWKEPMRVAKSVQLMGLKHAVITSVDRDDLKDGGASVWQATIQAIKKLNPETTMEVLIPDFKGKPENIQLVIDAKPEVISHNMETVRRLTREVRRNSNYDRSLSVLKFVAEAGIRAKSGVMVGLGETEEEVLETMDDLRANGVEVLTIGQYLQPTKDHRKVYEYIKPEVFERYRVAGLEKGFRHVESGPMVRSSYHAEKHVH